MKFWINILENVIYIILIATAVTISNYFVIKAQQDVMIEAINKQTTAITNEFKKVKSKKGTTNLNITSEIADTTKKSRRFLMFKRK